MSKDVKEWCRECLECQRNKISRHTKAEITPYVLPSGRFENVHIDIVGPLPPATQQRHSMSKHPENRENVTLMSQIFFILRQRFHSCPK